MQTAPAPHTPPFAGLGTQFVAAAWQRAGALGVSLRTETASDRELALRIYASTRAEELAQVPWSDEQKQAFLRHQENAQHAHYAKHYAQASFDIVLCSGEAAGRLYVHRMLREMRIVDIALLPAFRGRGLGGALLQDLQSEARACGRLLSIHVEHANPARRLYERLGFTYAGEAGSIYLLMHWQSGGQPAQITPPLMQ